MIPPSSFETSAPRCLAKDPTARGIVVIFGLLLALASAFGSATPGRIFWITDFSPLALLAVSVALLAHPEGLLDSTEERFWRDLARGFGAWLAAQGLHLLAPAHPLVALGVEALYATFFLVLVLALHLQPDRIASGRGESFSRPMLRAPTLTLVAGLFTYLLIVPALIGERHANDPVAGMALYLVLDTYVTLLLLHRWLGATTPRWRWIYGLLAATFLTLTLCDGLETLILLRWGLRWGTPLDALWSLPFVFLLLTCRLRDLAPPDRLPLGDPPPFAPYASPVVHILALALALPPLHFAYHGVIETGHSLETAHEITVLIWLLLLGGMAAHRHRILRRDLKQMGLKRQRMENLLVERRTDVRLMVEERQASDQLEASEENFARAFRHCPEAISVTTLPEGLHLELNECYARLIGREREEILGKTTSELGLWAAPWQRHRLLQELELEGRVWQMPLTLRNHAGQLRDLLVSAQHLEIEGGLHMLSVAEDITGQREIVDELQQQTELLNRWRAVVFAVDPELCLLFWSRRTAELTGLDAEAVHHRPLSLLLAEGRHQAQPVLRRFCAAGQPWEGRLELVGADHRRLSLEAVWLPVLHEDGTPLSWLVVAPEPGTDPPA